MRLVPSLLCLFISKELEELPYEKWTLKILGVTPSLFCLFTNKELEEFFLNILLYTETIPSLLCLFISKELEEFFILYFHLNVKNDATYFHKFRVCPFLWNESFFKDDFYQKWAFQFKFSLILKSDKKKEKRRKKKEERKKKKEARRQNNGLAYWDKLGACPFSTKRTLFLRTLGGKCGRFHKNCNPLATNMKMMILETNHNFWQ